MIDVYLCVVALADWDLILGEPILRMMQTIIDVTNQMITIQPKLTDRPVTLSAIRGARLYLHAVRPRNFLSSAEDANRVRGCY